MNTIRLASYPGLLAALLVSACGGGSEAVSPSEAVRLLIDQGAECFAVAAGRASPDKFDATAAAIASVSRADVCLAWPAGLPIHCPSAYDKMARPYADASQCAVVGG